MKINLKFDVDKRFLRMQLFSIYNKQDLKFLKMKLISDRPNKEKKTENSKMGTAQFKIQ